MRAEGRKPWGVRIERRKPWGNTKIYDGGVEIAHSQQTTNVTRDGRDELQIVQ